MQKLREHYESQDTEALLELTGKDLTDEARAVLNSVLSERGVGESRVAAAKAAHIERREVEAEARKQLATRGERAIAFLIDLVLVGVPVETLSVLLHESAYILIWFAYFFVRDATPKLGVGKHFMDIRVVATDSGRACTLWRSVVRNLMHAIFWIDLLFIFGERRMRLGDHIAGTRVVRASAS